VNFWVNPCHQNLPHTLQPADEPQYVRHGRDDLFAEGSSVPGGVRRGGGNAGLGGRGADREGLCRLGGPEAVRAAGGAGPEAAGRGAGSAAELQARHCATASRTRPTIHSPLRALCSSSSDLASFQRKLFRLDDHVGIGISGLTADARSLSKCVRAAPWVGGGVRGGLEEGGGRGALRRTMRTECLDHKFVFGVPIPSKRLVTHIANSTSPARLPRVSAPRTGGGEVDFDCGAQSTRSAPRSTFAGPTAWGC
jgi:Proteasome subunit